MKKVLIFLLITSMIFIGGFSNESNAQDNEVRATWITSVYNTDWPSKSSIGNVQLQKQELVKILDQLKDVGINTVMLQVRPKADALYNSKINPWSDVLTGTQGKNPNYDPLEFAIQEAHKRGIKIHAWLNPYRITTSGTDTKVLSNSHPAKLNPDMILQHNGALYYNPERDDVKKHIQDTIKEIVSNYNIDGIVLDDYFYPRNYPLPTGEDKNGEVANARRNHINTTISQISETIKQIKPNIKFGISPSGIWKNKYNDSTGSDTNGHESYYSDFADTRTWIKNNWIDYVAPQIYWEIGHKSADYSKLLSWWSNEVKNTNVDLYIGQGIYKDSVAKEIDAQLKLNKNYKEIKGSVFYTTSDILNNRSGCKDKIKNTYKKDTKIYYLDINSFIGEENAKSALNRLKADTGWYANYKQMNKREPLYSIKTGGFVGESNVNNAITTLKNTIGLNGYAKHEGKYSGGSKTPIYRIETGGFIGEQRVKDALNWLKNETGWWATYKPNGSRPNEYKIVTGGFVGEARVKEALDMLKSKTGWWAMYTFNGNYSETKGTPIYHIYIDGFTSETSAKNALQKLKDNTGWYANHISTGKYIHHYQIITGGFVGLENAKRQSEFVKNKYGWYNSVKQQ